MSHPAFILANGNLTYDPSQPNLCTDEPHVCYGIKQPVPPTPPFVGGSSGGWGGGKGLHVEELPSEVWAINPQTTTICTVLAKRLTDSDKIAKGLRSRDPLSPQRPPKDYDFKQTIHDLRGRIASLEEALERANLATMLPWKLYADAVAEIGRLQAALGGLEAEQARMGALIAAQQRAISELQARGQDVQADPDAGIRYNIPVPQLTLDQFEALHRQAALGLFDDIQKRPAPAPAGFPWTEVALAVGGYAAAAHAFPKSWKGAKAAAYTVSAAAGLAAVVGIIRTLIGAPNPTGRG
jgi:hypothetical protein